MPGCPLKHPPQPRARTQGARPCARGLTEPAKSLQSSSVRHPQGVPSPALELLRAVWCLSAPDLARGRDSSRRSCLRRSSGGGRRRQGATKNRGTLDFIGFRGHWRQHGNMLWKVCLVRGTFRVTRRAP